MHRVSAWLCLVLAWPAAGQPAAATAGDARFAEVRRNRGAILAAARRNHISPLLLAGRVYNETSAGGHPGYYYVKQWLSRLKYRLTGHATLGICEVACSLAEPTRAWDQREQLDAAARELASVVRLRRQPDALHLTAAQQAEVLSECCMPSWKQLGYTQRPVPLPPYGAWPPSRYGRDFLAQRARIEAALLGTPAPAATRAVRPKRMPGPGPEASGR